jgi:hypothetical protein
MQAAVACGQTLTTPLRFDGASVTPALMIRAPSGILRSFVLSDSIDRTARLIETVSILVVVFIVTFLVGVSVS